MASSLSARALEHLLGNWRTGSSAYTALAERIRLLVLDGRIVSDTRLPAERELSARLSLSRSTVGAAYAELRASGYLTSVRGSGSVTTLPHRAESAQPAGDGAEQVLNFTQAALPAISGVAEAVQHAAVAIGPYLATPGFDPVGLPQLRQAIADRYAERGLPTHPDEILVTSGALHALTLVARTLLSRGDRAVVETPTYPHAADALVAAGARLVPVAVTAGEGWDEEAFLDILARMAPTVAYIMPDFQNPTGESMSPEFRRRLVDAALRSGTTLIADETTAELDIDRGAGPESAPYAPLAAYGDAVLLGSASKTMWGGLRVGWVRAPRPIIRRLLETRASSDLGTPLLDQLAAAELIGQTASLLRLRSEQLRSARDTLRDELTERLPSWSMPATAGGLCAWVNLGRPVSSQLVLAVRSRGVLMTAGPRFGLDGAFERFLRIPMSYSPAQTRRAVDALQSAWRELDGTPASPDLLLYTTLV